MPGEPRTVRRKLVRRRATKATPRDPPAPPAIPRIARLMACAIVFDEMLARGEVRSYRELAAIGQVSAARVSQIMALLDLAPRVQEALLGEDARLTERELRPLAATAGWTEQRRAWDALPNEAVRDATHDVEHPAGRRAARPSDPAGAGAPAA